MHSVDLTPQGVYREYMRGVDYNLAQDLYRTVETNENFFMGRQWEGVRANGLPTPVFNFLRRVVLFSVANVISGKLKLNAAPLDTVTSHAHETVSEILNGEFHAIFERNHVPGLLRTLCRAAAVDGDGCLYTYWDGVKGIVTEFLPNTAVLFGNPACAAVERQPYIIIERRELLSDLRRRAAARGLSQETVESIRPDKKEGGRREKDDRHSEKVTVLLRLWKDEETGEVMAFESTRDVALGKAWSLGVRRYPVVWFSWEKDRDSYHGAALITSLIPNQIFVNKLFAMSMISLMSLAYPKVVYDKTRVKNWTNRVGAAIGIAGSVDGAARVVEGASVSPQIGQFIDLAVNYTQKFLGASDAALGDVRPDNTSAIIALQRASTTPLSLTRQALLECVEELGQVYIEFMAAYYALRPMAIEAPQGGTVEVPFDFSLLSAMPLQVELEAGESAYWSEIASVQTLDNLLMQGKISTVDYLKRLPAGHISQREELIRAIEQAQ